MSFNNPLCCGFVKTIYQYQIENNLTQNEQISKLKELFPNLIFSDTIYKNRSKKIRETFSKLNKNNAEKKIRVVDIFSLSKWKDLTEIEKSKHGYFECKGCLGTEKYRTVLSILPINPNDNVGRRKAEESGLFKPTSQQLSEARKIDVSLLNDKYKKNTL